MAKTTLASQNKKHKICSVEDCDSITHGRFFCFKHYKRFLKYGDVNFSQHVEGVGKTDEEKFWSRIDKTSSPNNCWVWQGAKGKHGGYGIVRFNGKARPAHKVAWFWTYQKMPNLHLLHSCDNPPCCNPAHLREGTDADNMLDKVLRNRQRKGESIPSSILTEENVKEIRLLLSRGIKGSELSRRFGVSPATISGIKHEKKWKHVDKNIG